MRTFRPRSRWMHTLARLTGTALLAGVSGVTLAAEPYDPVKDRLLAQLPHGALEVSQAMTAVKVGERVTLRGHVALSRDAFAADQGVFSLVDESRREGERPASDALPETVVGIPPGARATVRLVDAAGAPISGSLAGRHGLKPGAEVFVTGTVRAANGADLLLMDADQLHIPRGGGLPPAFFVEKPLAEARDISEARGAAPLQVGDRVALRGRVGGSANPFVDGRAVFTLVGRGLKPCNERPDDHCPIPWDYCCDPRDAITANSITVQVVDERGQPLRTDMKGRRGLKELSEIDVVGTVAVASGNAVVVNVTSMSAPR